MKTILSLIVILFISFSAMAQPILRNYDTTNLNPFATSTQAGDVIPDNVTITVGASGVISASGGGTTTSGVTNIVQTLKTNLPNVTVTNIASFQSSVGVSSLVVTNGETNLTLTASTDLESDANKKVVSLANSIGVKTNNNSGGVGWSTAFNGNWVAAGTLPFTAADTTWPAQTNFWGITNGPTVAGKAVVIDGINALGVWQLKATNWPTGGGSQTPWAQNIDAAQFDLLDLNNLYWTNTTTLNSSVKAFNTASGGDDGSVLSFTGRTNNASATASLLADRIIAQSLIRVQGTGLTNILGVQTVVSNLTLVATNAAPGNAVNPARWFPITNNGAMFLIPGYQ